MSRFIACRFPLMFVGFLIAATTMWLPRIASACSPPFCSVAITQPPIANFASGAVRIPVDPRVFSAVAGSVYVEDSVGNRIEVVSKTSMDGQQWIEPVGNLGVQTWYKLRFDGRCIPLDNQSLDGIPEVPGEFSFYVGNTSAEPDQLFDGISVAEQTIEWPGSDREAYRIVISLDVSDSASTHLGRINPSLTIDGHRAYITRAERAELRVTCGSATSVDIDSCGGVHAVGEGLHRLELQAAFAGGAPPEPLIFDMAIDCARLGRGEPPVIGAPGSVVTPPPGPGSDAGATDADTLGQPRSDGASGCTLGATPVGPDMWLILVALAGLRHAGLRHRSRQKGIPDQG